MTMTTEDRRPGRLILLDETDGPRCADCHRHPAPEEIVPYTPADGTQIELCVDCALARWHEYNEHAANLEDAVRRPAMAGRHG